MSHYFNLNSSLFIALWVDSRSIGLISNVDPTIVWVNFIRLVDLVNSRWMNFRKLGLIVNFIIVIIFWLHIYYQIEIVLSL